MSTAFDWAVEHTLRAEGVFANIKGDPGKKTKYGITEATARRHGYHCVEDLTVEQAIAIYRVDWWDSLGLDEIAATSRRVAAEIFDTAINTGGPPRHYRAVKIAQEALILIFEQDLVLDGKMGPKTRAAIIRIAKRYERHFVAALNGGQYTYYMWLLRQGHPVAKTAIKGWMLRLETPHPVAET